jgi:hypothetical protein
MQLGSSIALAISSGRRACPFGVSFGSLRALAMRRRVLIWPVTEIVYRR